MSNALDDNEQQQICALGRLGWPLLRIQRATGVRRETVGAYLKAAGIPVRGPQRRRDLSGPGGRPRLHRQIRQLETLRREAPRDGAPEARVVMSAAPREEGQVDYGEGPMVRRPATGKYRRTRLFVLTLACLRKAVRLLTWRSSTQIWCELHERAFRRLGGTTKIVVLDNLKEGVFTPDIYDPALNPPYRDMLARYGVVALRCRVGDPDRKGKVEAGVGQGGSRVVRSRGGTVAAGATWNNIAYQLSLKGAHLDRAQQFAESAVAAVTAESRNFTIAHITRRELSVVSSLASNWDTLGWVLFAKGDLAAAEKFVSAAWALAQHAESRRSSGADL